MTTNPARLNQRRIHCYTVREFARALGISPATVREWIKAGKVNALEVSSGSGRKSYRIHRSEVEEVFRRCGTLAGKQPDAPRPVAKPKRLPKLPTRLLT